MLTLPNFEVISDRICASGNYIQKWITKVCDYEFVVSYRRTKYIKAPEGKWTS